MANENEKVEMTEAVVEEKAPQKNATEPAKHEMNADEAKLRKEIGASMAGKVQRGAAVWQIPLEERRTLHLPVNPNTGNYFQSGTALQLMQAQHDMDTSDNRWISQAAINRMQKEGKDIQIRKGSAVQVVSNHKPINMFNYSQLSGKDVPKPESTPVFNHTKDAYGEAMLEYMAHKMSAKASSPETVTAENFFDLGRKAYARAEINAKQREAYRKDYAAKAEPYLEEYGKRLDAIKAIDPEKFQPKEAEDYFMLAMSNSLRQGEEKKWRQGNYYVYDAVKASLLKKVPPKKVAGFIEKLAPEAAKDPVKAELGSVPYSEFVMNKLKDDKEFQKQYAPIAKAREKSEKNEKKKTSAAR